MGETVRWLLLTVVLSGCAGEIGELPADFVIFDFAASVAVNPTKPVAGRNVTFTLELISHSKETVTTDLTLEVRRADGSVAYQTVFRGVRVHPEEVWNLTHGFLPATTERGQTLQVDVVVSDHDSGQELWRDDAAAQLAL